jgi:uncharacterized coiled-coil DUF342 family protein
MPSTNGSNPSRRQSGGGNLTSRPNLRKRVPPTFRTDPRTTTTGPSETKRPANDDETGNTEAKRDHLEDAQDVERLRRERDLLVGTARSYVHDIYNLNQQIVGLKVQAAEASAAQLRTTDDLNKQIAILKKQADEEKAIRLQASEQLAALQKKEEHWNEWSRETWRFWCQKFEARTKEVEDWKSVAEEESRKRAEAEAEPKSSGRHAKLERWKRENFEEEAQEYDHEVGEQGADFAFLVKQYDRLRQERDDSQRVVEKDAVTIQQLQADHDKVVHERDWYRRMAEDVSAQNYQWHMRYDNVVGWMAVRSMAFASEMAQLGNCGCMEVPRAAPIVTIDPDLQNCVAQVGWRSLGRDAEPVVPAGTPGEG